MDKDQLERLKQFAKEEWTKPYSRRQLLAKIPKATGLLLTSAVLPPEIMKMLKYRLPDSKTKNPPNTNLISKMDIKAENQKPGSKDWKVTKPANAALQGYASDLSVQPNSWITFFVHSEKPYRMEFYRMGYYQGLGGRLMQKITDLKAFKQNLKPDPQTLDCSWVPSQTFRIPQDWPTGVYLNKLIDSAGRESYIPFVINAPKSYADYGVVIATNTYHAYNNWGGKSLYGYNSTSGKQSMAVSFNRPFRDYYGAGHFFKFEYNLIRWLEKEGYSLTYFSDVDIHNGLLEQANIKALIIAGHEEYWSMNMRTSVENLTAEKINLAVFGANCGYWQVRLSPDHTGRPNRIMTSYKQFAAKQDPYRNSQPELVTGKWRDEPVNMPEETMFGTMYAGIPEKAVPMVVTNASHWLYEGTGLRNGDKIKGVIGGEVDRCNGILPGVEVIARSPIVLYGTQTHADVAWTTKPTGGKVFAVGTFYWNWFLDPIYHTNQATESKQIQQITRNALRALLN